MDINWVHVMAEGGRGADKPRFLRMSISSAQVGLKEGMILAGQVGKGGGACKMGFLSLGVRANAGMGGTGGVGEASLGLGGGEVYEGWMGGPR